MLENELITKKRAGSGGTHLKGGDNGIELEE
jgi:hypothetical protein